MKLRQKSKRDQALDAVASMAKTWSEWRLGERISKTATTGAKTASKKAKKASKKAAKKAALPEATKRRPLRIAGAIAVVGGVGAAVAKKLKGGKAEPLYTPPGPAPDMAQPPPSPVVVEDLAQEPASRETTPVPPTVEPALTAPTETPEPEPTPVVVEDLAGAGPAGGKPASTEAAGEPGEALAPEPEDLVSRTADEPEADADKPAQ